MEINIEKNHGFSLIEVIIALGLSGFVVLLATSLTKQIMVADHESANQQSGSDYLHLIITALDISSNSMVPEMFDKNVSYAGNQVDSLFSVNFTPRPGNQIPFSHKGANYQIGRGSSTIELASPKEKLGKTNRGVMVSRCINKANARKTAWSVNEILNLKYFPLPSSDGSGHSTLKCCPLGGFNINACSLANKTSDWRARVFKISDSEIQVWPAPAASPIIGTAFFRYFSDPVNYASMSLTAIVVSNKCIHSIDHIDTNNDQPSTCPNHQYQGKTESRATELNFYDAGIINLGR